VQAENDDIDSGIGMLGIATDSRCDRDTLLQKQARRATDAYAGIGHCAVVCCEACRKRPSHRCMAVTASRCQCDGLTFMQRNEQDLTSPQSWPSKYCAHLMAPWSPPRRR
jgi:hypothetical protein